ncbi:hypothetical protein MVEN_00525200 [Mycena venus]|uniref:Tail specific protease domain-containing protein n=1 Tax=Mycena venus TaxID=2733690 RepID=A0A8H7D556_9AGAR|nr:hypothetical protein MVEN_00525200 [Mycena venus]
MLGLIPVLIALTIHSGVGAADPCAAIAGKKWISPQEARSCMFSFPIEEDIKDNIIQVVNKTLPFHTSVNYQILAPPPYDKYVHEDIAADLARIKETSYTSDFDFHIDLYRSFRRLNDGHCVILNLCYDSLYISYLPTPLVLLTAENGSQNVHVAPEAFTIASAEFPDQIDFWQDSLPGDLKGQLASLSGAKVLEINGQDPFILVNENAEITGGYQAFGTRQNSFFSSYSRGAKSWSYVMGNFAQQIHPLDDFVELTIQRINSSVVEQVTIPYRSRIGSTVRNFTDSASYRANMCTNVTGTNGFNVYDLGSVHAQQQAVPPVAYLEQQPMISRQDRKHPINVMLDATPLSDVDLPEELLPLPVALNESYSVAQFYLLNDNITGVLALGSFSAANFTAFMGSLLDGLQELKSLGATHLVVDVTNNGGGKCAFISKDLSSKFRLGYICIAHWLHRILIGPKNTTEPQAGLYTCTRAGSLAQEIVESINKGGDPEALLSYNPSQWRNSSNLPFSVQSHWLRPTVNLTINGHDDAFSPRLGAECQPFEMTPPEEGLFNPENIVIISNGRCGSSCSLFSITMSKHEGVKTVVVGGHKDTPQQYCGVVGGQSTHFAEIDTEIKSTYLKNHTLAPPDFKTNSVLGITWRLAFGIDNPEEPEEWQDHPADFNLPLTMDIVNKPSAIWEYTANMVFPSEVVTDEARTQAYLPYWAGV